MISYETEYEIQHLREWVSEYEKEASYRTLLKHEQEREEALKNAKCERMEARMRYNNNPMKIAPPEYTDLEFNRCEPMLRSLGHKVNELVEFVNWSSDRTTKSHKENSELNKRVIELSDKFDKLENVFNQLIEFVNKVSDRDLKLYNCVTEQITELSNKLDKLENTSGNEP